MKRTLAIVIPLLLLLLGGGAAGLYHLGQGSGPFGRLVVPTQGAPTLVIEGSPPIPIYLAEGCEEPILEPQGAWLSLEWSSYGKRKLKSLAYDEGVLRLPGSFQSCSPSAGEHALLLLPGGDARLVPREARIRTRSWTGHVDGQGITLWTYAGLSGFRPDEFEDTVLLVAGSPRSGPERRLSRSGSVGGTEAWNMAETVNGETIELDLTPADKHGTVRIRRGDAVLTGELDLTYDQEWRLGEPRPQAAPATSASY